MSILFIRQQLYCTEQSSGDSRSTGRGARQAVASSADLGWWSFASNALEQGRGAEGDPANNDYVVLQEQSTLPIKNPVRMHENIRLFDQAIRDSGAKTALYLTWARQDVPEMQNAITSAYTSIGKELGATIVPCGVAWQNLLKKQKGPALHAEDKSHPTLAGSYLAACVFLGTLFKRKSRRHSGRVERSDRDGSRTTPEDRVGDHQKTVIAAEPPRGWELSVPRIPPGVAEYSVVRLLGRKPVECATCARFIVPLTISSLNVWRIWAGTNRT